MQFSTELRRFFDTLLTAPGMGDRVKLQLPTTRKNVLLLELLVEQGLLATAPENTTGVLMVLSKDDRDALEELGKELLRQAGLTELHEKLQHF